MSKFEGMTLNERLATTNQLSAFDTAVRERNKAKMMEILVSLEIDEIDAKHSCDLILANPSKYGFE